jgi:hypothetical protein
MTPPEEIKFAKERGEVWEIYGWYNSDKEITLADIPNLTML